MKRRMTVRVLSAISLLWLNAAWALPGDQLANVNLPVGGFGVSVGVDCEGVVYYTNNGQFNLYKMDKDGNLLDTLPTVNAADGGALDFDEMAWDETRQVLWAQLHGSNPVDVYTINPNTGVATHAWTSVTNSLGSFRDGIAYDGTDDTLWISGDVSSTIEHYGSDGTYLGQITPKDAAGGTLGTISGVTVGVGDLLYLGRNGLTEIVQVKKSNGDFIASFASPGGTRDEGLECDATNYAPALGLWSRDVNNFMSVIELEPGTCECGGGGILTCTLGFWKNHTESWENLDPDAVPAWGGGYTYLQLFGMSPMKGDASLILAHAYIAALLNTGAPASDLADALALLSTHPVGSGDLVSGKHADPDRAVAIQVAEALQTFNESTECSLP